MLIFVKLLSADKETKSPPDKKREKRGLKNMEKYFPELNEKYRKKNYPDGVFARMHKNTEKVSWLQCGS